MKSSASQIKKSLLKAAIITTTALPSAAGTLYWDTNGATAGSGNAAGAWDSGTNWTTVPAGTGTPSGWTDGESAVFSAGTDGLTTKAVTIAGTVATPSILLKEAGLVNLTGGIIDITGGSIFNTSVLGSTTARSLTWTSGITGTGPLTLAVNGDTSATGGSSNTIFALTGSNNFIGTVTITSGVVSTASNLGNASNKVILNGGGLVDPNLNAAFARDLEIGPAGGTIRNYGSTTNFRLQGALTGSGTLSRTDGGTTVLTGNGSGFTGALNVLRGTMQIGDGSQTSNLLANTSGITLGDTGGAGTVRYQLDSSFTLATPVTFANAASTFIWQGTGNDDVLTLNSAFGSNSATGSLRINSGAVTLAPGADLKVASVGLVSTPANNAAGIIGTLNVGSGTSLVTRYLGLGDGSNSSGIVNQTGGTVTIEPGGSAVRIGHWANGASPGSHYNLTGGTLDASAANVVVNVGWDGAGTLNVGGTGTAKAWRLYVDAAGADQPGIVNLDSGGTIEVGAGGTLNDGTTGSQINLRGGTLKSTASSTWASLMNANAATTTFLNSAPGTITSFNGLLAGSGNVTQTGTGEFSYNGVSTGFTGNLTVNEGTLSGTGTLAGNVTINTTIAPGSTSAGGSPGTLTLGAAAATTTLNGTALFDLNAASTATGNDRITAVGPLAFGGSALINPTLYGGAATSGNTYTLFTYTGGLTGVPTLAAGIAANSRQTYAIDTTTSGQVNLTVTGAAANLIWTGDGAGNAWDVNTTANWDNAGTPDKFYLTDTVSFTDAGNAAVPVAVAGAVNAGAVTVAGAQDYTFTGGAITGSSAFTKSGTGTATFLNDFTPGAMNITAGGVAFGNGGTEGALLGSGNITLAAGSTLTLDRSDNTTFARAFAAGSTGTFIKEGAGNLSTSGGFLLPGNVTVNEGTLTVTGGGFGSNRMEGNGVVTINPGATLVLAVGSAHAFGGSNTSMTESFVINGGFLTVNQEQYFSNLTLNGGTINGTSEIRATTATNWLVTGSTASTVAATVSHVGNASWNVADVTSSPAADLLISGAITGSGALNKTGDGTLRATGNNSFSGTVNISGGTLQAGSNNALGFGSAIGNTTVNGTAVTGAAVLDINGVTVNEAVTLNGGKLINSNTGAAGTLASGIAGIRVSTVGSAYTSAPTVAFSGGGGSGATATTAISAAALSTVTTTAAGSGYTSAPTVTLSGGAGSGATATAVISSLTLVGTANEIGGEGNLTLNAIITGDGGYTKTGGGTLTLGTGGSNFTGNAAINSGTVLLTAAGNATTSGFGSQNSARNISISNGAVVTFNVNNVLGGGATAAASLPSFSVNAGSSLTAINYNVLGALNLNGGTLAANRTGTPGSYQGFELKGPVTTGGSSQSVITATGGFGHHLVGNITFDVGEAVSGTDLLVSAPLLNSSSDNGSAAAALTKTGPGTMSLNAASTYTGTTTVQNGTLLVNGAIGTGAVTIGTSGKLGGGGAVAGLLGGMVTIDGTLSPGNSAGTLAIAGNLLLNETATLEWEIAALSPLTLGMGVNDLVTVGGQLTLDGTLNVSGLGSFGGVSNGTWTLLTYSSLQDNGLTLGNLPALDPGLSWQLASTFGQVNLSIVPEPGSAMLGMLGLLLVFRRRP